MSVSDPPELPIENRPLAALPSLAYLNLLPNLECVPLLFEQTLCESREPIEYVYFPNHGVISVLTIIADSTRVEVGLVGNEGMVGLPVFLGVDTTLRVEIVQVPGKAMRLEVGVFKALVNRGDLLRDPCTTIRTR